MRPETASRWTRRGSILAAVGAATVLTAAAASPERQVAAGTRTIHLLGDSWAAGLYADPSNALGQVAARTLGWALSIDAVSGTGYLNAADDHTYPDRASASTSRGHERLVVVQGGSNDDAMDLTKLGAAVSATLGTLGSRFPAAKVMLLGPGPDPAPVTSVQWKVDGIIRDAADAAKVPYVSMLAERWIPPAHIDTIIDPGNHHPTRYGQKYLGLRLAAALRLHFRDVIGG